jgi:FeS assembly SUF system protein
VNSVSEDFKYPASILSLPVLQPNRVPPGATPAEEVAASAPVQVVAAEIPKPTHQPDPTRFVHQKLIEGKVIEALKQVYDPEIPVNIYELGLIYHIEVKPDDAVEIKMTLTAPACPVAGTLPGEVEKQVQSIPEVTSANVELVWEPPWSRDMMSEAALLQLGML